MEHQPTKLALQGANVLTPTGWLEDTTVLVADSRFVSVDQATKPSGYGSLDVSGLQMLPGLVDIHGDAFERMICPRPSTTLPLNMALVENDRALLAAGITTFFYSITDAFEPGLRSRDTARLLINHITIPETLAQLGLKVDSCIHIRHEQANTANHDELCQWLESGQVTLLSLNPLSLCRWSAGCQVLRRQKNPPLAPPKRGTGEAKTPQFPTLQLLNSNPKSKIQNPKSSCLLFLN